MILSCLSKTKLLWVLKQDLRKLTKGGKQVSEVHELMVNTIKKVGNGEIPIETAQQQHLAAHRAVMDNYSEIQRERMGMNVRELKRVQESVERL